MKARPGPDPKPISMLSAAIACWTFASPPKLDTSRSRPLLPKMPVCVPTSIGTKENAVLPALPTRSMSAPAEAGGAITIAIRPIKPTSACRSGQPKHSRAIVMLPVLSFSYPRARTKLQRSSVAAVSNAPDALDLVLELLVGARFAADPITGRLEPAFRMSPVFEHVISKRPCGLGFRGNPYIAFAFGRQPCFEGVA